MRHKKEWIRQTEIQSRKDGAKKTESRRQSQEDRAEKTKREGGAKKTESREDKAEKTKVHPNGPKS